MKQKLADILVRKNKIILIVFIVLALGCAALIPLVNINQDMTKYLPADSSMRKGLDIMEIEFDGEASSTLKIMFNDLKSAEEKTEILDHLSSIQYVDSVDYEVGDEDYNKDGHTLYIVTCDGKQYSKKATYVWQTVKDKYEDSHDIVLGGTVNDANESGLPIWILCLAVGLIIVILFLMCSAWIEPVAFLITIGIAVLINIGTYVLFPSISKTTFSIVGILQLGLSMDYSIMLLNRYRQQRTLTTDKNEAMRSALSLSFAAITGSSFTTFAGLLALVFMSFTMGADLGLSLAKGVLISLLCIFTVLPALLLGFDDLMARTVKPSFSFDLPKLSRFQYKLRIPLTLFFVGILLGSFVARQGVDFSYSQGMESATDQIFGYDNTMVMIYNEKDGKAAGQIAESLDGQENINSAICYESSLGKQRTASSMKSFMEDMRDEGDETSSDMDLSTRTLRMIYYDYYASDQDLRLTIPTFIRYLREEVMNDETFGDAIDDSARANIDDMDKFTDVGRLTTAMNASGLAGFFGMKTSQAKQLLLYYKIKSSDSAGKMSLPKFLHFLIHDAAKDKTYGKQFSAGAIADLKTLQPFTQKDQMTTPVPADVAATYLNMDPAQMQQIYGYYFMMQGQAAQSDPAAQAGQTPQPGAQPMPAGELSVQEVVAFLLRDETMSASLSKEQLGQLAMLQTIIDTSVSGKKLSPKKMAKVLGMKTGDVRSLYFLHTYMHGDTSRWKLTPQQFINFLVDHVLSDRSMKKQVGGSASDLRFAQKLIHHVIAGTQYTSAELADFFAEKSSDMSADDLALLYELYGADYAYDDAWTLDLLTLVHHLDDRMLPKPAFAPALDDGMASDVRDMRKDLDEAADKLRNEHYGRMIISADMEEDSDETRAFMDTLHGDASAAFAHDFYMIGNTPMAWEMSKTFRGELNKITLITILFILIIVLLTFRRITPSITLVLVIQGAVFMTMSVLNFLEFDMYYLALLIVQSIMMGATIDYAIIYSTYYIENRLTMPPQEAIRASYKGSLQTILTSATIFIAAVGVLSFAFSEPATRQICRILSLGCLIATLLVIFLLPAILSLLDRFIVKKESVPADSR